ncbi:hypothetical protein BGZ95_004290, partial [Linnemannia exigua]
MQEGFFDIPELVSLLDLYLHPPDLLSCIQVNRTWNRLFTPSLWRIIDDSTDTWVDLVEGNLQRSTPISPSTLASEKKARDDWLFGIFAKYGHHIQHLKIQYIIILQAVSEGGTCKGLKSLVIGHGRRYMGDLPEFVYRPPPLPLPFPVLMNQGQVFQAGGLFGAGPVAGGMFGATPAIAGGGLGAVPVAAVGGLGAAPAVAVSGFGAAPVASCDQAATPAPPRLTFELSEPKFPSHLRAADVIPQIVGLTYTDESRKALAEYGWINAQHLWHLVRTNLGLTRFDTNKRGPLVLNPVSADYAYSTLRTLNNLKVLDCRKRFRRTEFWKLLECLPEGIESLSVDCGLFPLPEPLPGPRSSLRVLHAMGTTTINGLLTLLEVFPNLTHLDIGQVASNPSEPRESSSIPLRPSPKSGGHSLRRLDSFLVEDWDTVLRHIPSIVEWSNETELCSTDVPVLNERFGPKLEALRARKLPASLDDYPGSLSYRDPTNQFLVTHSHLREFDSIENFIKVDEMLRQPWACMGLERLTCRIVGVERLNKDEEA